MVLFLLLLLLLLFFFFFYFTGYVSQITTKTFFDSIDFRLRRFEAIESTEQYQYSQEKK